MSACMGQMKLRFLFVCLQGLLRTVGGFFAFKLFTEFKD